LGRKIKVFEFCVTCSHAIGTTIWRSNGSYSKENINFNSKDEGREPSDLHQTASIAGLVTASQSAINSNLRWSEQLYPEWLIVKRKYRLKLKRRRTWAVWSSSNGLYCKTTLNASQSAINSNLRLFDVSATVILCYVKNQNASTNNLILSYIWFARTLIIRLANEWHIMIIIYPLIFHYEWSRYKYVLPWGPTLWDGGGSQTWVIPALARSGMEFFKELYHPPLLLDSQLNPCDNMYIICKQI
jgi:hypothetical protein